MREKISWPRLQASEVSGSIANKFIPSSHAAFLLFQTQLGFALLWSTSQMDPISSILKEGTEVFGAVLVASQLHMVPLPSETAFSRAYSASGFSKEESQGVRAMTKKSALKSADLLHLDVCLGSTLCWHNVVKDVAGFCYLEWKLPCKKRCANQGFSHIDGEWIIFPSV